MDKYKKGVVVTNAPLIRNIYSMVLAVPRMFDAGEKVRPGQFVGLYTGGGSSLLPRPLGICESLPYDGMVRLVYRCVGKGTEQFSDWEPGTRVMLLGPLGNGFSPAENSDRHIIVGGGMGVVPLLELAKTVKSTAVLGYEDEVFLTGEFKKYCSDVNISTVSGKNGIKGNVIDVLKDMDLSGAAMYACGPKPMLKALSSFAADKNIPLQISVEERMACGIGSCLGCAVEAHGSYKRVCKDGPVFDSREVVL